MKISIIVATAKNQAIGRNNDLLWHLPADMKFFRETTAGHCILTGRKNYLSIPEKYRPLKNRTNIVVTRASNQLFPPHEDLHIVHSIEEGIELASKMENDTLYIIGGGEIYRQTVHLANELLVTEVDATFSDADTFFPEFERSEWKEVTRVHYPSDERNGFNMDFVCYQRK